jgi:hypothetical protein
MRKSEEFRDRQLQMLSRALRRPALFCPSQGDLFYGTIIRDLAWLKDRPKSDVDFAKELLSGSMGVFGQFWYQGFNQPDNYQNEVASVYAQAAFRLSYFRPERLLTVDEYLNIQSALDTGFLSINHTESELIERFGKPSHDVVGGQTTVHCFGCVDPSRDWIYFDYSRCYPREEFVAAEWFDDPILRDIRRRESTFEILPFAEWFRHRTAEKG